MLNIGFTTSQQSLIKTCLLNELKELSTRIIYYEELAEQFGDEDLFYVSEIAKMNNIITEIGVILITINSDF